MRTDLLSKLSHAQRFLGHTHAKVVNEATRYYNKGDYNEAERLLGMLPTAEELLEALVTKLNKHGKAVYRTLKQMKESKGADPVVTLKGLSSLMTHVIIEMEQGHKEYGMLLPILSEKQAELIYGL
jgi:hypothetical protein